MQRFGNFRPIAFDCSDKTLMTCILNAGVAPFFTCGSPIWLADNDNNENQNRGDRSKKGG